MPSPLFGGGASRGVDPELKARRDAERAKAEKERADEIARSNEEKRQRGLGRRGQQAFMSGGFLGFGGGSRNLGSGGKV